MTHIIRLVTPTEEIDGVNYNKLQEDPGKWIQFHTANTYNNQIDIPNKRLV